MPSALSGGLPSPLVAEAANRYAEIRHHLLGTGEPIGELDMLIAADSLSAGAVPITNELRHYERIDTSSILENWA